MYPFNVPGKEYSITLRMPARNKNKSRYARENHVQHSPPRSLYLRCENTYNTQKPTENMLS